MNLLNQAHTRWTKLYQHLHNFESLSLLHHRSYLTPHNKNLLVVGLTLLVFGRSGDVASIPPLVDLDRATVHPIQDAQMLTNVDITNIELSDRTIVVQSLNSQTIADSNLTEKINRDRALLSGDAPQALYQPETKNLEDWLISLTIVGAVATMLLLRQQAELYQKQMRRLNADLEDQVQERTVQLSQALRFEASLKRIIAQVCEQLDENQILQIVAQELALGLSIKGYNLRIHDPEQTAIATESVQMVFSSQEGILGSADPQVYEWLLQGQSVRYCPMHPADLMQEIVACPMMDDRGVIGDVWLLSQSGGEFSEAEIHWVEQVTAQCAIAIRHARLYHAAQSQIAELERLNRVKDDFLSTVSHELRTPMTSIKMAIQMLEITLKNSEASELNSQSEQAIYLGTSHRVSTLQAPTLKSQPSKADRYFKILQDECEREIGLINDLLDLSRLDAGGEPLVPSTIEPRSWILHLVEPFIDRAQRQQQRLDIDLPATLSQLTTDLSKLERILTELLNNACKYTPIGEQIRLSVRQNSTSYLTFTVMNSGVDVSADELPRIFDKFYRIPDNDPRKSGGTGLGLALVKKLIGLVGGSIKVQSAAHEIRFIVELPLNLPNDSAD